jgi:hypothetical protein
MKVGSDIIADVSFLGDLQGKPFQPVPKQDTLGLSNLSLVEGDIDFGVPFLYSNETKNFGILKNRVSLKEGVPYKLRGIGINELGNTPTLMIPSPVDIDSIVAIKSSGTLITLKIFISKYKLKNENYYIQVRDEMGKDVKTVFQKNIDAYKALTHKSGFLVSGSRVQDGMLEIMIDESNQSNLKNLKVEISNVSSSFYDYNYFYSNAAENPGSLLNPATAAFNIKTDMAYGSFSALNSTEKIIPVK